MPQTSKPYKNEGLNSIYELLFCDNLALFNRQDSTTYPFNILFSDKSTKADLQKIIDDKDTETRTQILAYNKLRENGQAINRKELLAVIIEVGLDGGLDVLASYRDGTARYINYSEKLVVWETRDNATSNALTQQLFADSETILKQIGPWDGARRPFPTQGVARITLLVSDGLYFGEGPMNVLFNDAMASPALNSATALMSYLMDKSMEKQ